jgi:hypothetical protein
MTTATLELSLPVALSMFTDLLGRKVTGSDCDARSLDPADATVRGVFMADGEVPGALYLVDLELAAAMAAALVMMPAGLVKESVSEKTHIAGLAENSFEVLNVASRLVNRAGGVHYKLREQILPGASLPEDVAPMLEAPSQRIDLDLTVEGYGSGRLVILIG